ncbi:hypothetical protein N0390_26295, partial [Pseudomonas aeruginosa]|nr:hypothetical protein [Pseudomonas aeruginosa]
ICFIGKLGGWGRGILPNQKVFFRVSLVRKGFKVMAYPGAFSTLAEIAAGDFPGMLDELQKLTVVSLQLKRR